MADKGVAEIVAETKATVEEFKKTAVTKAEFTEKLDKVEGKVAEIHEALKKDVRRATSGGDALSGGRRLASFGVRSVKQMSKGVEVFGRNVFGQVTPAMKADRDICAALELGDQVHMLDAIMRMARKDWPSQRDVAGTRERFLKSFPEIGRRWDALTEDLKESVKALDSTTAGSGDEWVPTGFATNLLEQVRLMAPETNLFSVVNMPTNPWVNPVTSTVGTAYIRTENTAVPESSQATANRTWTAYPFARYVAFSDEVAEDSAIAVIPSVREDIIRSMAEGLSMAIVNGDSGGAAHIDDDLDTTTAGAGQTYNSAFDGLRQFALDVTTRSSYDAGTAVTPFTSAEVRGGLRLMGKFATMRMNDVALLLNSRSWIELVTESGGPTETVDKYGPSATILTGELAKIYGVSVFASFAVENRKDKVSAIGYNQEENSGVVNTLSTAVLVARSNFRLGDRRDVRFETDKDITAGKNQMVATARWAFQALEKHATDATLLPAVVCIVDIA